MHFDELIHFCFQLPGATETFPFDKRTLVIKVQNKMFALVDVEDPTGINLKCDPEKAVELRERYDGIQPGYHMSKKHWNTVSLEGLVDDSLIKELIVHSYDLVVSSLPKKLQDELKNR
ncbi:MmcQ/YjbR family DNA-binding protein [uncultured Fluviicola sp.]|uniref:MmcQ/YjbR family DNA-binding protein n=1 Tax=uncultured Fluviicola sp. TaxID=463303 RepID=UPI0025E776AB|nr:MmcQ/YjbR family DNA-binding protein [uncultured Fluviicola sp.]